MYAALVRNANAEGIDTVGRNYSCAQEPPRVLQDASNRRKWTDATEMVHMELDGVEPWNQKSMDFVKSHLVCGEVGHVRHYPGTSPEKDVFLHGVDVWDLTLIFFAHFDMPNQYKTIGVLWRGTPFPARSGHEWLEKRGVGGSCPRSTSFDGKDYTNDSATFQSLMNHIIMELIDSGPLVERGD